MRAFIDIISGSMPTLFEAASWPEALKSSNKAVSVGFAGWKGLSGMEILEDKVRIRNRVLEALRSASFADRLIVFGSVMKGPDVLPGDVDVFLDAPSQEEQNEILKIARMNFGYCDTFVRINGKLMCQVSTSHASGVRSFEGVKKPTLMISQIMSGVPLSDITWNYSIPDDVREMPVVPGDFTQISPTPEQKIQQIRICDSVRQVENLIANKTKGPRPFKAFDVARLVGEDQLPQLIRDLSTYEGTFKDAGEGVAFIKPYADASRGMRWHQRWY